VFQELVLSSADVFFHDDGRICLVYRTPATWKMSSITIKADRTDHFILKGFPDDVYFNDVATSPDFSALLFVKDSTSTGFCSTEFSTQPSSAGAKGWLVRCHHAAQTVETVEVEDNMQCSFLVRSNCT